MQPLQTRLRERAIFLGLSDAEVARRAGLSERRYGHYVTGEREPDLGTLVRISDVLGVTPNELLLPFETPESRSGRDALGERLQASLSILEPGDIRLAIALVECLAKQKMLNQQ